MSADHAAAWLNVPRDRAIIRVMTASLTMQRSSGPLLPRGLHRTRVSEMRARRVSVPACSAGRHPFPVVERVEDLRPPFSMG